MTNSKNNNQKFELNNFVRIPIYTIVRNSGGKNNQKHFQKSVTEI